MGRIGMMKTTTTMTMRTSTTGRNVNLNDSPTITKPKHPICVFTTQLALISWLYSNAKIGNVGI